MVVFWIVWGPESVVWGTWDRFSTIVWCHCLHVFYPVEKYKIDLFLTTLRLVSLTCPLRLNLVFQQFTPFNPIIIHITYHTYKYNIQLAVSNHIYCSFVWSCPLSQEGFTICEKVRIGFQLLKVLRVFFMGKASLWSLKWLQSDHFS